MSGESPPNNCVPRDSLPFSLRVSGLNAPSIVSRPSTIGRNVFVLGLALSLATALGLALSKSPIGDEGLLAAISDGLVQRGVLGVDNIEPASYGNTLGGNMDKYTYYQTPLQFLCQAALFRLTGYSLMSARLVPIMFAMLLLVSFYGFMRKLFDREDLAGFATMALGVDYFFCQSAALARNDMIAAALMHAALASYLIWYQRHPERAVLTSQTALALSGMAHPVGGIIGVMCFVTLYLCQDRKPFSVKLVALAALPYLVIGGAWGWYILQAPDVFRAQFFGNAAGRGRDALQVWTAFQREATERYLPVFWGRAGLTALAKLRAIMLVGYLSGLMGCLMIRELRRASAVRTLLALTGVTLVYMIFFDATKQRTYLVYAVCFYVALFVVLVDWMWRRATVPKPLLALGVTGLLSFHLASSLYRVKLNELHRGFYAVSNEAQRLRQPTTLIDANVKFGFGIGPGRRSFIDDPLFGCTSGRVPDIAIRDLEMDILTTAQAKTPELKACVARVFSETLTLSATFGEYQLWTRKP